MKADTTAPAAHPTGGSVSRDAALDVARALAVTVMVVGHTFDATLSAAIRGSGLAEQYWRYRGVTAPLFLFVSGWAVVAAASRSTTRPGPFDRWPRAALLLACGYLLRLPTWGWRELLEGSPVVWRHTLAFDALHLVGTSLALTGVLLALFGVTTRFAVLAGGLAVAASVSSQWIHDRLWGGPIALTQVLSGGDAPFAFFPWASFFLVGAAFGASIGRWRGVSRAVALAVVALPLVLWGRAAGMDELGIPNVPQMGWRLGHVLLLLALASVVPALVASKVAPLGKRSLAIYLAHLPLVYGWGSFEGLATRLGPKLGALPAFSLGLLLLAVSLGLALAWERFTPPLFSLVRWGFVATKARVASWFVAEDDVALAPVEEPTNGR